MVQVDVFWAYGLGASLAAAAGHKVLRTKKPFENKYFIQTILFLALVWAPTGMFLLLRHPSWETMQAADQLSSLPPWLVLAFGITNITQGILGYYIGIKLLEKGRDYWAQINWMLGYFGMFFILVYGWDGQGYDRFFYDRDMLDGSPAWQPYASTGAPLIEAITSGSLFIAVWKFLNSSVFITLMIDAVFLIPIFGYLVARWYIDTYREYELTRDNRVHPNMLTLKYLTCVFIVTLGVAIFSGIVVHYVGTLLGAGETVRYASGFARENFAMHVLSYVIGLPLSLAISWFLLLKPGRIFSGVIGTFVVRK